MKNKILLLFILLLTLSIKNVYAEQIGYTNISNMGFYEDNNYSSTMIDVLKIHSKIKILDNNENWFKIKTEDNKTGWIEKYFLTIPVEKYVLNKTDYNVNLRKGPSTYFEAVGQLSSGEKLKYIDTYHSWHIVEYNGEEYYIASWLTDIITNGSEKIYLLEDKINIRDKDSFNSNVIAQGNKYEEYIVHSEKNGWLKIKLPDGKFGFVAGWLTTYNINYYSEGLIDYKSTIDTLNIRTGPSTDYTAIKALNANTSLKVISTENGWDKVITNDGQIGWCYNNYLTSTLPLSGKKILLDPGHGGKDTGCISYSGRYEKHLNLIVAKKLKLKLESLGANVYMTRNDDTYINNKERGRMADRIDADILFSIHHNSLDSSKSDYHGMSTYYNTINHKDSRFGYDLAESIYLNAITLNGVYRDGILDRNFQVLRETNTPAALIEIGFMSNPQEELNIQNESFQNLMVEKLSNGIIDYFK